jgi:branched-subunit amino acid ABC-type transport system permease component
VNSSAVSTVIAGTLTDGATLSLIAAGFVVIYRATRVVTFAQGFFMVAGALIFVALDGIGALGLYGSLVIAAVLTGVISAIVFRGVLTRLIGVNHLVMTTATIGIATAGLAVCDIVQGDQTMILPNEPLGFRVIKIAGFRSPRSTSSRSASPWSCSPCCSWASSGRLSGCGCAQSPTAPRWPLTRASRPGASRRWPAPRPR